MLERSAKPAEDCIFTDPTQNGVLKLHNIGKWGQENIAGDYKWFVFLPKGQNGSCLGLSDKYCGFTAVEAMFTEENTDTVVLKGTGNVSWISGKRPVKVLADIRRTVDTQVR